MSSREASTDEQIHETQEEDSILSFYPAETDGEEIDDLNISEVKIELCNIITL